jgi:hypothetical protein
MKDEMIRRALGIETGDGVTTSYGSGPYVVIDVTAPFTHFEETFGVVILDHPEVCLTLGAPGALKKGTCGWINNVRRVGDRWFNAMNDEIFVSRAERAPVRPSTLLDLIDPPDRVEELPAREPYAFDPSVDYRAGSRRVWRCAACGADFNSDPVPRREVCFHDCGTAAAAKQIYFVEAPAEDDRRRYASYYVMTLNRTAYRPLADERNNAAVAA